MEENKILIQRFVKAFNNGDLGLLRQLGVAPG